MKASELIEKLKELDPSGDMEVLADGSPIYTLQQEPSYYDGCKQTVLFDDEGVPCGGVITHVGSKISIGTISGYDALFDHYLERSSEDKPFIIEYDFDSELNKIAAEERAAKLIKEAKQMRKEIDDRRTK